MDNEVFLIAVIGGGVLVITLFFYFVPIGLWITALFSGVRVSIGQLIGMRLRKVDVRVVVRSLIMATQAGVPVPSIDMERAYLQGVDLEKITLALIHAHREGKEFTFQELVEADLENRLNEKLGIREGRRF